MNENKVKQPIFAGDKRSPESTGRPSRRFGTPSPTPAWSFFVDEGRNDPAELQHFWGGEGAGKGGVFGFYLETRSSIFPNIFVQDCRLSYGTNCFDYHIQ